MRDLVYLLRFFRVVSPVPRLMRATFLVIVCLGAVLVVNQPAAAAAAAGPVLLLQLFAASSGFAVPARRGYYDLLLTSGARRVWIAAAHWLTSIVPGVAAWVALAAVEWSASAGRSSALASSGTCAAVAMVSTLPWAITVALPRFSGGVGWLLVLAGTAALTPVAAGRVEPVRALHAESAAWAAWTFLVYPLATVGRSLSRADLTVCLPALTFALLAMVAACAWIVRLDAPLEAAQ